MTKKIAIMQPYFFPYIGYWQLINAVDEYVVYDDVNFIKGGWINRNNILLNGKAHLVTLPLENSSSFKHINEIEVVKNRKMKEKICKTIAAAYLKAPYYKEVYPIIENSLLQDGIISNIIYDSIIELKKYIGIDTKIVLSSQIDQNRELTAEKRVIDIVKNLDGTVYINAIGGQSLYDKQEFKEHGIDLFFIKTNEIIYRQFNNEFVPNLSIIDVLMFNSPEQVMEMLNNYELI